MNQMDIFDILEIFSHIMDVHIIEIYSSLFNNIKIVYIINQFK